MTLYSAMVEVTDQRGIVREAVIRYAATQQGSWVSLTDLGEGWLSIRVRIEAVSLVAAAQEVVDLVSGRMDAEPLACYVMPEVEFARRVPREDRLAVA